MARENYNPDAVVVAEFKGLATAGGDYGGDPSYLQNLTNAFVTKDGRLRRRRGSSYLYGVASTDAPEVFQFTFAGERFMLHRFGVSFAVYRQVIVSGYPVLTNLLSFKSNVLRSESATEPATYAVKTENNYCHVMVATASTTLVSFTLTYRDMVVSSVSATTASGSIGQWFSGNVLSQNNSKVFTSTDVSPTTAIANSGATVTLTWASRPGSVVVGSRQRIFSCFWLQYVDANYYPGSSLYSTGLRRNTVPLDVNVEVPEPTRANYILNEPLQDLDFETYWLYESTTTNATRLNKVTNRQPLTVNDWDFSDGGYRASATLLTNRTPNYVAFGGLQQNNFSGRVGVVRLRTILLSGFEYPSIPDMECIRDISATQSVVWHSFNGTVMTSGEPKYFSVAASASSPPGTNLEAVVELIYKWNATNTANAAINLYCDVSPSKDIHTISDGARVPLYGYNILAKAKSFVFPNIVRFVGNRLVLSGNSNQVLVSAADWNYRGFTFTNCQVSSLGFSGNSPYLLQIEQAGGNVRAIESVNGVMIVVTDSATYRVSGKERNSPPTAETAIVSRLTNQITNAAGLVVAENSVYLSNDKGLYKLNYVRENDEGVLEELSLPVISLFGSQPDSVVYSRALDSLLIRFPNQRKLLAYSLLTRTFYQVHISIPYDLQQFGTFDGFVFSESGFQVVCCWNPNQTVDLFNINFLVSATLQPLNLSLSTAPTSASNVAVAPALIQTYVSPPDVVLPAYSGQVRTAGTSFTYQEQPGGNTPKQILGSAVTKAIYTDKLSRGIRLRDISLVVGGTGTLRVSVPSVDTEAANQRLQTYTLTVASTGTTTITGEQNKAPANPGFPSGDSVVVHLGNLGVAGAYAVGFGVGEGVEVLGFQLNTSAKANQRLT